MLLRALQGAGIRGAPKRLMDNLMDNLMDVIPGGVTGSLPKHCVAEPTRKLGQHARVRILGNPRILQARSQNPRRAVAGPASRPSLIDHSRSFTKTCRNIRNLCAGGGGWQERATYQTMSTSAAL